MAKRPNEMSNEELLKNETALKILMVLIISGCVIMLAAGVYLFFAKGGKINTFLFLPITFAAIGFSNYTTLKGIKKEKANRSI